MNKKFIWTILILLVIAGLIFVIVRKPKEEEVSDEQEIVKEDEEGDDEYAYTGDTDFSSYSVDEQVVGEESDLEYAIQSLEDNEGDGFHEFVFTLKQQGDIEDNDEEDGESIKLGPLVVVSYVVERGAIRIDLQKISQDATGIRYLEEREIGKNGVLKIYHAVSGQEDQELYDIGISKVTPFKLTSEYLDAGVWEVNIKVKYPGSLLVDVDLGSDEFSRESQVIQGIGSEENASITAYSYGRPNGLLKLLWSVSGNRGNDGEGGYPIPQVEGFFNEDGDLVIIFESLTLDRVANFTQSMNLSSGITATVERLEERSIYLLKGIPSTAQFKLSVSPSPYQVILEII